MSILFGESMERHPESQNHGGNVKIVQTAEEWHETLPILSQTEVL